MRDSLAKTLNSQLANTLGRLGRVAMGPQGDQGGSTTSGSSSSGDLTASTSQLHVSRMVVGGQGQVRGRGNLY